MYPHAELLIPSLSRDEARRSAMQPIPTRRSIGTPRQVEHSTVEREVPMLRRLLLASAFALFAMPATPVLAAGDNTVEVLHWWTSGGEAAALNVLKKDLESKGVTWQDMPVAGGGGEPALTPPPARGPPAK